MHYTIRVRNDGNHIHNPLLKLAGREYATRDEACEAIFDALYDVIDSENGCDMLPRKQGGTLYVCDRNGNNAEPLNANDDPYPREDAETVEIGDCDTIRATTANDDLDASIDYVAVRDGQIVCYYQWINGYPLAANDRYIDRCHDYIVREGGASEDGVSASVEEYFVQAN